MKNLRHTLYNFFNFLKEQNQQLVFLNFYSKKIENLPHITCKKNKLVHKSGFFKKNNVSLFLLNTRGLFIYQFRSVLNIFSFFYFMLFNKNLLQKNFFLNLNTTTTIRLLESNKNLFNINLLIFWLYSFLSLSFGWKIKTFKKNQKKPKIVLSFYNKQKKLSEFKRLISFFIKKTKKKRFFLKLLYFFLKIFFDKTNSDLYKFKKLVYKNFLNYF